MNTLVHIRFNTITDNESKKDKRNAWILYRAFENERKNEAIAKMRVLRFYSEEAGFNIIGEAVLVGTEHGAAQFAEHFIARIPCVDCIIVPTLSTLASEHQDAFNLIEKLIGEGISIVSGVEYEFLEARSTTSILRALFSS